jgi:hypothetical protein
MTKEDLVIKNLIVNYLVNKKFDYLEKLLTKLRQQGKLFKIKKNLNSLKELLFEKYDLIEGVLELACKDNQEWFLNKYLSQINKDKKILVKKIKINKDLILGGILRTKKLEINFSLLNIINKNL